jgi:hypothetical protein
LNSSGLKRRGWESLRREERRGLVERRSLGAIPISCSAARLEFSKEASGGEVRSRARAGWAEAGSRAPNDRSWSVGCKVNRTVT